MNDSRRKIEFCYALDDVAARVAAVCAAIKFLLAGLAVLYMAITLPFLFLT
jgi:hypothetical protein